MNLNKIKFLSIISSLLLVWFFSIYPILVLYAHNAGEVLLHQVVIPLISSLIFYTAIYGLWWLILKNNFRAGFATIFAILIFWNYDLIFTGLLKVIDLRHWHLMPLLLVIYSFLVYMLIRIKHQKLLHNLNTIFLVPITILIMINVFNILRVEIVKPDPKVNKKKLDQLNQDDNPNRDYPDIFLIILDEYASFSTIYEEWDYDNSGFAQYLRESGFFIAGNSDWRYYRTIWNICSLLNLDYVTGPVEQNEFLEYCCGNPSVLDNATREMLQKVNKKDLFERIASNKLTGYLKDYGYNIIVLEAFKSMTFNYTDYFMGFDDFRRNDLVSEFTDPFSQELIRGSILYPFVDLSIDYRINKIKYNGTKSILNYLKSKAADLDSPKFVLAHILCPHHPLVFDLEGNFVPDAPNPRDERIGKLMPENNDVNHRYLDQYIYMTNQIKDIINSIMIQSTEKPVIMIQSDHSPRPQAFYLKDKTNAFSVLNVVYFPDGDYKYMYDSIAPINIMRILLNKYFDTKYELLDDR